MSTSPKHHNWGQGFHIEQVEFERPRTDEQGDEVFPWFCHKCGEGGFARGPDERSREVNEHIPEGE